MSGKGRHSPGPSLTADQLGGAEVLHKHRRQGRAVSCNVGEPARRPVVGGEGGLVLLVPG